MRVTLFIFLYTLCLTVTKQIKGQVNDTSISRNIIVIRHNKHYKEKGIIFKKEYSIPISINDMNNRYTPSLSDIEIADSLFINNFPYSTNNKNFFL